MKKISKFFGVLMAFAIIISSMLPATKVSAVAVAETYDVVLTKILMDSVEGWPKPADPSKYNGGKINNIADYFGDNSKTLDGVWFEIRKDSENGQIVSEGLTNNGGIIEFIGLNEGTYYITENKEKSTVEGKKELAKSAAIPMKITLPVWKADGTKFTTKSDNNPLYVYPKNTVDEPDVHKYVNETDQNDTALIGEEKQFRITSEMPEGIKDYKLLEISDQMSKGLTYKNNMVVKVKKKAGGESIVNKGNDFTVDGDVIDTKEAKFNIKFKETFIKTLVKGDIIEVTYKAIINEDATLGAENPNTAKLIYGTNPSSKKEKESEKPELHTGGKRFVKKDAKSDTKLKDAKFLVLNKEKTKYLKQTLTDGKVTKNEWIDKSEVENKTYEQIEAEKKVTIFSSGENGEFEVVGLPFGAVNKKPQEAGNTEYYIKEIKAPKDYALITEPQMFIVNYNSYYQDPTNIDSLTKADPDVINNNKVTIPQTGGIGSIIVIAGGILITTLGIYMKKRNSRV